MINLRNILILIAILFFFIISLYTLPDYGTNWDTINHLPRGQAFLHFFLTGRTNYSDLPGYTNKWQDPRKLTIKTTPQDDIQKRRSLYQNAQEFNFFIEEDRYGHPPLSDIFSSAFNVVLYQKLGLINDIDSYRVYGIVLVSLLVGLIFYWSNKINGWFAGVISALSLTMYPLFWAESHFNTEKDIPETVYWSFLIFCVWKGFAIKSWKWILASSVFFGLALGTKFNILFVFFVIVPYLIYIHLTKLSKFDSKNLKLFFAGVCSLIVGFGIFYISWPYLWVDPIGRIHQVINFYHTIGIQQIEDSRYLGLFGINLFPMQWILFTTPPTILMLSILGAIYSVWKIVHKRDSNYLLFILWFSVPIVRVSMPGANIYGGVRQIMEFIPAMALLAGFGASWLVIMCRESFKKFYVKEGFIKIIIVASFIPVLFQLVKYHPYENVYFNFLIGGLSGAKSTNFPYWGNTFGSAYRQGAIWLNDYVENGAHLVYAYDLYPNIPRIFLRNDIQLNNKYRSGYLAQGEYAIGLVFQGSEGRSYYDTYLEKFVIPVYEIKVDGITLLKIWKNEKKYQRYNMSEVKSNGATMSIQDNIINIKLPDIKTISKVNLSYIDQKDCINQASSTYSQYSLDGIIWTKVPLTTTDEADKSLLINDPKDGKYTVFLTGEKTRFIQIKTTNSCLLKFNQLEVFEFNNL